MQLSDRLRLALETLYLRAKTRHSLGHMADLKTLPPVAKNIFHECKKCGVERYLKVLAHVDDKKFKIECEVCHTKKTLSIETKKKAVKKAVKKDTTKKASWVSLKESADISKAKPYNMKAAFGDKEIINHPKFGIGFVVSANGSAIEVQFEDTARSLVHNRVS